MAATDCQVREPAAGIDRRSLFAAAMLGSTLLVSRQAEARPRNASYRLAPDDFSVAVEGLEGAEGVAVGSDGSLYLSNAGSTIARRTPDGAIHHIGSRWRRPEWRSMRRGA